FCFERLHGVLPRVVRLGLFAGLLAGLPLLFYHTLEQPLILVGKRVSRRFEEITARSKICRASLLIDNLATTLAAQRNSSRRISAPQLR
ncbi:MAG TPA: hypothetical protein VJQ54_00520, partial [Candidatus Sulfotelmatobacter sp.]|nr:hypothetical protein [Candidatus Sulfotelmatobacter sp.]